MDTGGLLRASQRAINLSASGLKLLQRRPWTSATEDEIEVQPTLKIIHLFYFYFQTNVPSTCQQCIFILKYRDV